MMNDPFVETLTRPCHSRSGFRRKVGYPVARFGSRSTIAGILGLAALASGCATKPRLPPGVHPSVEVGAPLKSEAWKQVATAADEDRLARLGLAWEEALTDARKSNAGD